MKRSFPRQAPLRFRPVAAFTLIELLTVVTIIGTLVGIVIVCFEPVRARAEAAGCIANMRSLHVGLASYTQEVGHWPQPDEETMLDTDAAAKYWPAALDPYTGKKVWQCPTYARHLGQTPEERLVAPKLHYTVTQFDSLQFTPYRWSTMPWVIEVGNFHGSGNLVLFGDGSIRPLDVLLDGKLSQATN